ncbi:MAG: dienelactone hydrolase, partial [Planctomycetes bacterium]|nr:dienelactone hydrolase [Planctomycetota bacterium]
MTVEFKLPDIGEGVAEGEIVRWIVKEGDAITEDQPMVEVMTDKATVEITSPVTGTVGKILAQDGEVVPVHSVIVHLEESGGAAAPAAAAAPAVAAPAAATAPAAAAAAANGGKVLAAPATRKLAREHGIDLGQLAGSGPRGRITRQDVQSFLTRAPEPQAAPAAPAAAPAPVYVPRTFEAGGAETVPYRGIRKATGDQMVRSMYTAPHFTYVDEIDMTDLYALRKQAAQIGAEQGVKVTFLPFIIKALCAGIRRHPSVNAELDEERGEITVKHDIHIGIATDTDNGLMVPVVKHADQRSTLDIAAEIQRLSGLTRTGKASRDELTGSTITITSAGSIGGLFATPIINFPEVAILGVYQIKDKPVIRDGAVVPGKIGYLSITLDHRCVDGATAAYLMNHMKRLLE